MKTASFWFLQTSWISKRKNNFLHETFFVMSFENLRIASNCQIISARKPLLALLRIASEAHLLTCFAGASMILFILLLFVHCFYKILINWYSSTNLFSKFDTWLKYSSLQRVYWAWFVPIFLIFQLLVKHKSQF